MPTIHVVDALGLCALRERDATLDGSVPLRVAHACVPFMEGNAFGLQLVFRRPLRLKRAGLRGLPRWNVDEEVVRAHAAALPVLAYEGLAPRGSAAARELSHGPVRVDRRSGEVRAWTGLLVQPARADHVLNVLPAANRAALTYRVQRAEPGTGGEWLPLFISLRLAEGAASAVLRGEVATVAVFPRDTRWVVGDLQEHPAVARAHVDFYDATYFASKKSRPTRKYRRLVTAHPPPAATPTTHATCTVVRAGPGGMEVDVVAGAPGVTFNNLLDFTARYDGQHLDIDFRKEELARAASTLERRWAVALGDGVARDHRGALLYMTRYFSPHPPGEPHFFIKPWALVVTPPGWSCVVEGPAETGRAASPAHRVLRGVIRTDIFHAVPAVFHVATPGVAVHVRKDEPVLRVTALPHAWLRPRVEVRRLEGGLAETPA